MDGEKGSRVSNMFIIVTVPFVHTVKLYRVTKKRITIFLFSRATPGAPASIMINHDCGN